MIIYLVRHGEALAREGKSDGEMLSVGLSPLGKLQAAAAASALSGRNITRIVASPVVRAKETADIIGQQLGLPVKVSDDLREFVIDRDGTDIPFLSELKQKAYTDPSFVPPEGESLAGARDRFIGSVRHIVETSTGDTVIVAHRMVIEATLEHLFGYRVGEHDYLFPASVSIIRWDNPPRLISANQQFKNFSLHMYFIKRQLGWVS